MDHIVKQTQSSHYSPRRMYPTSSECGCGFNYVTSVSYEVLLTGLHYHTGYESHQGDRHLSTFYTT